MKAESYLLWCEYYNIYDRLLICEKHARVDESNRYKILRINYDKELNNVPLVKNKSTKMKLKLDILSDLRYKRDSIIIYYPYINRFCEYDYDGGKTKPDKDGGIIITRSHDRTEIISPKEYFNQLINILPDLFEEIKIKFLHHHVRFTTTPAIGIQRKYIIEKLLTTLNK